MKYDEAEMRAEFNQALIELPEVPGLRALEFLVHAAMNSGGIRYWNRGKELQMQHRGTIPFKTEYECAAGMWSDIRAGLLAGCPSAAEEIRGQKDER